MSIGGSAIGAEAIAAQSRSNGQTPTQPPPNRRIVAKADAVERPEAR